MLKDELKYGAIALFNIAEENAAYLWENCTDEGAQRYYRHLCRQAKEATLDAMHYCVLLTQMLLSLRRWMQSLDHEIPLYLEADLKQSKPVQKALPPVKNEVIALLSPAKSCPSKYEESICQQRQIQAGITQVFGRKPKISERKLSHCLAT